MDHQSAQLLSAPGSVAATPDVLAPLRLHYLRWVIFDVGSGPHFMYQGIFDTDFDKYLEDAVALVLSAGQRKSAEYLAMVWQHAEILIARLLAPSSRARFAEAITTAAAPSSGAQISSRRIGSQTSGELSISSRLNSLRYIAYGLWTLFLWFL